MLQRKIHTWTPSQRKRQAKFGMKAAESRKKNMAENPAAKNEFISKSSTNPDHPIVAFRIRLNMTQSEQAKALGVTKNCVEKWEMGSNLPSRISRFKLDTLAREKGVEPIDWEKQLDDQKR